MNPLWTSNRRGLVAPAAAVGVILCACGRAVCVEAAGSDDDRREALIRQRVAALPDDVRERLARSGADKVPVLVKLLGDRKTPASVMRPAVEILGHLRDKRSVEALGTILWAASSSSVRRGAVWALGEVKGSKAALYLVPLLDNEKSVVRRQAATAIASALKDPAIKDPADLLAGRAISLGPAGQMEALRIIDRFSTIETNPAALRALLRMLSSDQLPTKVARECIKLVGARRYAGMDEAREGLREALRSEDPLVRGEAAVVLARAPLSREEREEILPDFLEQLGLEDETGKGKALATRALARVTNEGEGRNVNEWRVWGVKQGYGDPGRPVAPADWEPPAPLADLGTGYAGKAPRHDWYYVLAGVVGIVIVTGLFAMRFALVRRKAAAIEAGRRKVKRRLSA